MKKICNIFLVLLLMFTSVPSNIIAEDHTTEDVQITTQENEEVEEVTADETIIQEESEKEENIEEQGEFFVDETEEVIEEISYPAFSDNKTIDDVKITVEAEEGVFSEGSKLSVEKVVYYVQKQVDNVLDEVRNEEANVVASYTFDIKILDSEGNEIQPKDDSKVKVSFTLAEASNENLDTNVYHIDDKQEEITSDNVQTLDVVTEGEEVVVETNGFSIYTVEFTYNNKEYVLTGDYWIKLSELLEQLDLTGNIESWQVSNSTLFDVCLGNDEEPSFDYYSDEEGNEFSIPTNIGDIPYLVSLEPFDTTEWLKVVIDGIEYEIVVTDDQVIINGVTQNIPGVKQGEYISNFTSDMQVATIFIDETKVNQLPASGNSAEGKILNGYDSKGFYFDDSFSYSTRTGNVLHFNASKWKTTIDNSDGTTTEKTGFYPQLVDGVNHYWIDFPGDVVEYVFKDGAQSSTGALYDVIVTFSDVRISLQSNVGSNLLSEVNSGKVTYSTFAGNAVLISNRFNEGATITSSTMNSSTNNGRYGLMYNTNIRVVEDADAATRITVPGTFIYPMVDLDVRRDNQNNFRYFYESSKYKNYGEQIQIRNNNFGDVFIPYQASEADTTQYKCSIDSTEDGLLFYPRVGSDSDTLLTGFVTLANNSRGGINIRGWSAGSAGAGVETYLLTGGKVGTEPTIINHKIKSSTKTFKHDGTYEAVDTKGGTIETTQAGNKDGTLDDGTTILGPNILTVASGETVNYTMTPNIGYKATAVYVKEGSLDYTEGGEITPTPVYDEDGVIKYYTFKFERINKDNAIHIEWEPDVYPLKVTKTTTDNIAGTFDYTLELSTRKTTKARIYNISIVAGIATTVDEETGVSTTEPYYYFFNTGDEFVVNGITVPTGSFTNGGTGVGLDAICDVLMGTIQENPITVQLGSELGTLSTEAVTSVVEQVQELINEGYTSASLEAITYTFSSPEKTEIIPWAFEELPDGVEGSNGTYTFKVTNGETFTIPNMPNGVYYTLTEQAKDGWTCKSTNPINTRIKNANGDFNYLNEYNAYDLTIKKETVDNEEGIFSFVIDIDKEVEIPAQSIDFSVAANASGGQVSYNLINNRPQFTVEYNGQHITIPAGTYIYGADENVDNFINVLIGLDDVDSVEMKLNGENGIASTEETESLASKVQTLLDGGYSMFALEPVAFNISSPPRIDRVGLEFDTLPNGVIGTNGLYRFTLTNGQSVTFSGIPHGYEYEVKEVEDIEWELIKIEESSAAEILQVEFEDLSTITPIMEVNGHIVTTGGGQQPGDHFQAQAYSSQTYMRLRYGTDGKTSEFTSTNHTVSYDDEITFIYPQAAIMPDGTKKDVLVTVSNVSITKPENVASMNVNFKGAVFRATGGPALATRSFGTNSTQRTPSSYTVNETVKVSLESSSKNEVFKVVFDGAEYVGNGHDGITFAGQISGSSASTTVKPITLAKQENIDDISANEVIENPETPEYFNTVDGDSLVTYTNKKVPKYNLTVKKETENNAPGTFNFTGKIYREETIPGANHTVQIEASIVNGQSRYVLHNTQHALEIPEVGFIPAGSYVYGGSNQILNGIIETLINNASSENPYEFTVDEQDWTVNTDIQTPIGAQIEDLINQGQTDTSFEPIHYTYVSEPKVVKHYFVPDPLPEGVTENNGVLSFSLENGKSVTFEEILKGHKFEIVEQDKEGWRNIEKVNDTGVLEEDTVAKFVNKKIINLIIRKEADENTGEEFEFKVKIWEEAFVPDENSNAERVLAVFTRNQMEPAQQEVGSNYQHLPDFVLPSDSEVPQYITDYANNLSEKSRFESAQTLRLTEVPVTELIRTSLFTEFNNNKYEVVMSDWMDGTSWASGIQGKERDVYFQKMREVDTFMDLSNLGGTDNNDGSYTFKIKSGESLTINEIPYGYKYEIYEIDSQGNRVAVGDVFNTKWQLKSATNTSGTLEESTTSLFTNEIKRGSIKVNKETKGNEEGEFKFKAKVWKETIDKTSYTETYDNSYGSGGMDGDHDQTWGVGGFPEGSVYQGVAFDVIYEIGKATYTSVEPYYYTIPGKDYDEEVFSALVDFVNKLINTPYRQPEEEIWTYVDDITIDGIEHPIFACGFDYIGVEHNYAIAIGEYAKTIEYIDLSLQGGTVTSEEGVYEFTINNGENFTIDEIPFGYKYEVYEETPEGWDLVSIDGLTPREKAEGTIESEEPYEHTFLNAKRHKLVFEKKVSGNMGDKYKEFEFEVKVYGKKLLFSDEVGEYLPANSAFGGTAGILFKNPELNQQLFKAHFDKFEDGNFTDLLNTVIIDTYCVFDTGFEYWSPGEWDGYSLNNGDVYWQILSGEGVGNIGEHYSIDYPRPIEGIENTKQGAVFSPDWIDLEEYGGEHKSRSIFTFKLKHGDKIEIEVPYGYTYEIVEKDYSNEGYKQSVDGKEGREVSGELTEDKNHLFENRNQAAVPTEIRIASYGAGLVCISILVILIIKKNRRKSYVS